MSSRRPTGQRYSFTYLEAGPPVEASPRLQRRLGAFFAATFANYGYAVAQALKMELGAQLRPTTDTYQVSLFLEGCDPRDLLEAVTIVAQTLAQADRQYRPGASDRRKTWVEFVDRSFKEENLAFEIDDAGGIHPRVDRAFQVNKTEAVAALGAPRYASALAHFKGAYAALDGPSPNTNRAIREVHLAVEDVFKLVQSNASRFDAAEAARLKNRLQNNFSGPELEALKLMMAAAADYSSASHQYRHAPGSEEPQPASMDTAALMLSQGTSLLRWLIALDQKGYASD